MVQLPDKRLYALSIQRLIEERDEAAKDLGVCADKRNKAVSETVAAKKEKDSIQAGISVLLAEFSHLEETIEAKKKTDKDLSTQEATIIKSKLNLKKAIEFAKRSYEKEVKQRLECFRTIKKKIEGVEKTYNHSLYAFAEKGREITQAQERLEALKKEEACCQENIAKAEKKMIEAEELMQAASNKVKFVHFYNRRVMKLFKYLGRKVPDNLN